LNRQVAHRRRGRRGLPGDETLPLGRAPRPWPWCVPVIVIVIVIVPLIVAALVNGNDAVSVIDAVNDQGSINFVSIATIRSSNSSPRAYSSASINSSTRMTSRCAADSIAEPLAIV
jgi:hypothetical protein